MTDGLPTRPEPFFGLSPELFSLQREALAFAQDSHRVRVAKLIKAHGA